MTKYPDVEWVKIDVGREGLWEGPVWKGTLEIVARHEGERYDDPNSTVYIDLKGAFPEQTWGNVHKNGEFHSLFRDYSQAWTKTGTLDLSNQTLKLTPLARKLLAGEISPSDVFLRMFKDYEEDGENPFSILAAAFIESDSPLSLNDLYNGVMKGYRPNVDNLSDALTAASNVSLPENTSVRRLKHILALMENAGAISKSKSKGGDQWVAWNLDLLRDIASAGESAERVEPIDLSLIPPMFSQALTKANLTYQPDFIIRFCAALLAKPFIILTGLSGSGKTKLAQALAAWLSPISSFSVDPFRVGTELPADRISYYVTAEDRIAIEMINTESPESATKVTLPRALIEEWAAAIKENNFTKDTPPRKIRSSVAEQTSFSSQLNSFETHLKAAAFALLDARLDIITNPDYEVIAVGADWTSNENILGFPDALDPSRYIRTRALDLILRAINNPNRPHFLILDEMNLSHVERYFADILSAVESQEPLRLHGDVDGSGQRVIRDGVPPSIELPSNLFIIGTVNVDETTYTFSSKVLDRANAIEFLVSEQELDSFLNDPRSIRLDMLAGTGEIFGEGFVRAANNGVVLASAEKQKLRIELLLFFNVLGLFGAEFGFRTANEITRFIYFFQELSGDGWQFKDAMDAQIYQKMLPKLHGSRRRLEPVLCAMGILCYEERIWQNSNGILYLENEAGLLEKAADAAKLLREELHPLAESTDGPLFPEKDAYYPLSYKKIVRLLKLLEQNGFASFAEA